MLRLVTRILTVALFLACVWSGKAADGDSEVVVLDDQTFEHLTQASTGSTTGDWLVEFYAPWCGHCKSLAPIWERVANELVGTVNVAKLDCIANRATSLRFGIKGFPSVMLFSKGRTYLFKEARSFENFVEFARGGFKLHGEGEVVPKPLNGWFAEIEYVFRDAYTKAKKDLKARKYFTTNTVLVFVPVFFCFVIFLLIVLPIGQPKLPPRPTKKFEPDPSRVQPTVGRAAPSTSARDSSFATAKDATKND